MSALRIRGRHHFDLGGEFIHFLLNPPQVVATVIQASPRYHRFQLEPRRPNSSI